MVQRVEGVQPQIFRQAGAAKLAADGIAVTVQTRREHADPDLPVDHRQNAAADAALGRQAHLDVRTQPLIMLGVQIVLVFLLGPAMSLGMPFVQDIAPAFFLPVVLVVVLASWALWPAAIVVGSLVANAIASSFRMHSDTVVIDYIGAGAVFSEGRMNVLRVSSAIVMYLNVAT